MPGIMIPVSTVEEFTRPRDTHFPEGTWIVTLEETREKAFPDFIAENVATGKNVGYTSGEGKIIGLQFGGATAVNGSGDSTNQKLFVDLIIQDGDVEITDAHIPGAAWQMQNSAALLAMLAGSIGATERVELDGKEYYVTADNFLDDLRSGSYDGQLTVGVTVYHRTYAKRTDEPGKKTGVEVKVKEFFQSV